MDMLRQLTRRFRAQDINDPSPPSSRQSASSSSSASSSYSASATRIPMKEDDVVDSGTASDDEEDEEEEEEEEEEIARFLLPESTSGEEKTLNEAEDLDEVHVDLDSNQSIDTAWSPVLVDLDSNQSIDTAWNLVPTSAQSSPQTNANFLSTSSSSFSSFGLNSDAFPMVVQSAGPSPAGGRHSVPCSNYERCSLDSSDAASCSSASELGFHSSEEELARVVKRDEKRKRSQLSDDSSVFSDDDDDDVDDDDEVHELLRGQNERLFRSLSVRLPGGGGGFLTGSGSEVTGPVAVAPGGGRGSSPRKRHRRDCWGMSSAAVAPADVQHHRPSLDFYKMQKTCMIRKHRTLNRPRLVKLWIVNGANRRPSKTTFDPSPFCFRSLSWTPRNTGSDSPHQRR